MSKATSIAALHSLNPQAGQITMWYSPDGKAVTNLVSPVWEVIPVCMI